MRKSTSSVDFNKEAGSAMVFALMVMSILMVLATAVMLVTTGDSGIARAQETKKTAQYVAEAAVERAKEQIYSELAANNSAGALAAINDTIVVGGTSWTYNCTITQPDINVPEYTINVRSTDSTGAAVKDIGVILRATYASPGTETTTYINQPITTSTNTKTSVFDQALTGQGKGVGNLVISKDMQILGPVYSYGGIIIHPSLTPNDITGPIVSNSTNLEWPEIDADYIKNNANKTYNYGGTTYINASLDFSDNDIVYVNGNLDLTGNLSGSVLIYATGNIRIFGDYYYPSTTSDKVIIISGGNLTLEDGPDIRGLVFVGNNLITHGDQDITITGSLLVYDNTQCGNLQNSKLVIDDEDIYDLFETDNFGTGFISNFNEITGLDTQTVDNLVPVTTPDPDVVSGIKIIQWDEIN